MFTTSGQLYLHEQQRDRTVRDIHSAVLSPPLADEEETSWIALRYRGHSIGWVTNHVAPTPQSVDYSSAPA